MKYLLDTHAWIWWNMTPQRLSQDILSLLGEPGNYDEILLSAISPWEFSKLLEKGRLTISCDPEEWLGHAFGLSKMRLVPLTPGIAYKSTVLPGEFHGDPADQIIAATAREENAVLITKDRKLQDYRYLKAFW